MYKIYSQYIYSRFVRAAIQKTNTEVFNSPHLDSREALLGAVFYRTPAALGQVSGSVLTLGLHQDLQLLSFVFL